MRPLLTRSQGRVFRAITAAVAPVPVVVEVATIGVWASLTFTGERHHLVLRLPEGAPHVDMITAKLPVHDAIVAVERADWVASAGATQLTIDLLLLDHNARYSASA